MEGTRHRNPPPGSILSSFWMGKARTLLPKPQNHARAGSLTAQLQPEGGQSLVQGTTL